MRWTALVLTAVFSCAGAQEAQRTADYMNCLAKKVPDLDDGISDAGTIARGLRSACLVEFNAMVNELSKTMTIGQLRTLDERAAELQTESAIRAVLTARVAQRKAVAAPMQK